MSPPDAPTAPTRLLLLRHGETTDPTRFHGCESDIGLSARGRRQADAAAEWIATGCVEAVYSSALGRARDTAAAIATRCGLTPRVEPALHERRMGPLSGVAKAEGWAEYHDARDRWCAGDLDATHAGGESYRAIRDRVAPAFARIAAAHPGRTVAAVAHGIVIRVFLTACAEGFTPADWDRIAIEFLALHELAGDGRTWRVEALNRRVIDAALLETSAPADGMRW